MHICRTCVCTCVKMILTSCHLYLKIGKIDSVQFIQRSFFFVKLLTIFIFCFCKCKRILIFKLRKITIFILINEKKRTKFKEFEYFNVFWTNRQEINLKTAENGLRVFFSNWSNENATNKMLKYTKTRNKIM